MEYNISQMVKYTNLMNNEALNNLFFIWYFIVPNEVKIVLCIQRAAFMYILLLLWALNIK